MWYERFMLGLLAALTTVVVVGTAAETVRDRHITEQRAEAAEERANRIVREVLAEIRAPTADTERNALFTRTRRIEELLVELCEVTDGCSVDP